MVQYYQNILNSLQGLQAEIAQLSLSQNEASSLNESIFQLIRLIQNQIWELMNEPES